MNCEICNQSPTVCAVPSKTPPHEPVHTCMDCAKDFPNVYYDGPPIFHFKSEDGRWYYVFVHHDHLTPYFYPSVRPGIRIAGDSGGIVFKTGRKSEYEEAVCERDVPYTLKNTDMDTIMPTEKELKIYSDILYSNLVKIRCAAERNMDLNDEIKKIANIANALHNLPLMFKQWEKFDIEHFKDSLQHFGLDDWIEYLERNGL